MALTADDVKATLQGADHPLGIQEILRFAGVHPGAQTQLKRLLRELVREGAILREGKRFSVPRPKVQRAPEREPRSTAGRGREQTASRPPQRRRPPERRERGPGGRGDRGPKRQARPARGGGRLVEGRLSTHRDGFGFVKVQEGDDIFLPPAQARRAVDGDLVRVEVVGGPGSTEGRLVEVVDRLRQEVVGTYQDGEDGTAFVTPNDPSLRGPIRVPPTQLAQAGDMVKVRLGVGRGLAGGGGALFGEVSGSLGKPGHPSQEVLSIVFAHGFSDEFPGEVMDAADAVPLEVDPSEASREGRRDLRALRLVTIDGADARDFDDAVYAEARSGGGWRLWVAIADVTHYVREGEPLDAEALGRGTSVYLPDRVLPMLPERLSNGICSLRPEVDRLCMVAEMEFDAKGRMGGFELYPGVMRSAARCTYEEVQDVLDGKPVAHREAFRPQLQTLQALARALRAMREERGAIDFDLPETKVVVGKDGYPRHIERRERKESHRLIEECMLAANEAVAKFFLDRELPSVYRFHGTPDLEKLETFAKLARAYGFPFQVKRGLTSAELNAFIKQLAGHPEQRPLNQLLLRSMMQAVYSAENVGHYGLAAEQYLHFTSPIRRYPDLLVHRLLKAHWGRLGKGRREHDLARETERLEELALHSSERERAAVQVEREVSAYYAALLMKDRVGELFEAVVSSVVEFGFFVELASEGVEGLVKAETLGPGAKLNTDIYALVYPDGRKVRVGNRLRVRLTGVNLARRQIDFQVESFEGERPHRKEAHARRPQAEASPGQVQAPRAQEPEREEAPARSPHPGFDRLRALAQREGGLGQGRGRPGPRGGKGGKAKPKGRSAPRGRR